VNCQADFLKTMQRKVAITAVNPSALRGREKGTLSVVHDFLSKMSLRRIPRRSEKAYRAWLDRQTSKLFDLFLAW